MTLSDTTARIEAYQISRGTDRWHRRWQAEWTGDCETAARAWTRRGVLRKSRRWWKHGTDVGIARRRHAEVKP